MLRLHRLPLLVAALCSTACGARTDSATSQADLVVYGRVWTGDSANPWTQAVAIQSDTIAAVGDSLTLAAMVGTATRVIGNGKAMVVPGFMDGHAHFLRGGFQLTNVDLRDAATPQEFVARIKKFAATLPPGEWILGGTWDHERWPGTQRIDPYAYRFDSVPNGVYQIELRFAEIENLRIGRRLFDVIIEDATVLPAHDIAYEVGSLTAEDRSFFIEVHDNRMDVRFVARGKSSPPVINALRVTHRPDR